MGMGCECYSYNGAHGRVPEVVLQQPEGWYPHRPHGVPVDACIAHVIEALWAGGVSTGGCCCGHGRSSPDIVLSHAMDAQRAADIVRGVDDRRFVLRAWVLADLGGVGGDRD